MGFFAANEDVSDLMDYVYGLNTDLAIYETLFVPLDHIDILNKRGKWAWRHLQVALRDRIMLSIARLFDDDNYKNHATGGLHEMISLKRVIATLPDPPKTATTEVRKATKKVPEGLHREYEALKSKCHVVIEHRHKRLAHNDKKVRRDRSLLPGVDRKEIAAIIDEVAKMTNRIALAFGEDEFAFSDARLNIEPNCDFLISALKAGNEVLDASNAERLAELRNDAKQSERSE